MTDPYRKYHSGDKFVPSARQLNSWIDAAAANDAARLNNPKGLVPELNVGVVLVRNDTGADITHEHAVIAFDFINDVLITPAERGSVVFERPAFAGITPDASHTATKRFGILQQPLPSGAIGKAVVSGASWVKLRGPVSGYTEETLYANPIDGELEVMEAGGSGPAKILWHESIASGQTGWAVVTLGTDTPPLIKVQIVNEPTTSPNQLIEDHTSPASAQLVIWDDLAGSWTPDGTGPTLQVYPDPGFRGVAFVGDMLEIYFSRESNRWQAVNGGHRVINAVPKDGTATGSGFTAYAFADPSSYMEIPIVTSGEGGLGLKDAIGLMGFRDKQFTAVFRNDRTTSAESPDAGVWLPVADWAIGCSLQIIDCLNNPGSPCTGDSIELHLDGNQVAGKGLIWDAAACELKLDSTTITCAELVTAIPCCSTICSRLDQIESDITQMLSDINDLFNCCQENTDCCLFVLDNCCTDSSKSFAPSGGGNSGGAKNSAIVPASWSRPGYTALFVEECPEVRFDDVIVAEIPQQDCFLEIDPKYLEVCEPDSIEVCGTSCEFPIPIGARTEGDRVAVRFAETRPEREHRIVIRLTGIRKGFAGLRFPDKTREEFDANERWLQRR